MTLIELSLRFDNPYNIEAILKSAKALNLDIPDNYDFEAHKSALAEVGLTYNEPVIIENDMQKKSCCGGEKPPEISIGFGDTVAKITHKTGLDKLAKLYTEITGKDCGCKTRQAALNKLLPYKTK